MSANANRPSIALWSRYWWLPGLALAVLVFLPSLTFYFVSDDFTFVLFAARHQPFYHSPQNLFYRPLPNLLWQFDYNLWGLNATGYHLTNLLLHAANVYLIGLLTLKLTNNRATAVLSSLLFALLPVHVEAVAWLSGGPDLLTTFFSLLTLLFWLNFSRTLQLRYYLLALAAFGLSIFDKEASAGLPFVLLGWAYFWRKPTNLRQWLNLVLALLPFFLLILIYLTVRTAILGGLGGYGEGGSSWLNILWNVTAGLWLPLLFPLNWQSFGPLVAGGLTLVLVGLYAWLLWQWSKIAKATNVLFALLLMYGGMLAALPIAPVSTNLAQSRLLYLPSTGFCMLAAILLTSLNLKKAAWLSFSLDVVYSVGLILAMQPWATASTLARDTFSQLSQAALPIQPGDTLYYQNLPDNYAGAYVWRNGIDEATSLLINASVSGINRAEAVIVDYRAASNGNIWFVNYSYDANKPQLTYANSYTVSNPALPNVFATKNEQIQNWDLTLCKPSDWQLTLSQGNFSCKVGRGIESDLQGQAATFSWQSPNLSFKSRICYLQLTLYVDYDFQIPQIPATLSVKNNAQLIQKLGFELAADGKNHRYTFVLPQCAATNSLNFSITTKKSRDDMRWQAFSLFS